MITTEIQAMIEAAEAENIVLHDRMRNTEEKAECRRKILANNREIMRLKSTLMLLDSDKLMKGKLR